MKKYLLFLTLAILLSSCSFKGTNWNVNLNLPLMDEKYPVID
ncbi:MAG: lipoprotein, partial [Candidatus Cloacimonetes bacterium]|nr:lipoprotein [Candidatus Cloacimonadota bacterium]